MVAVVVVVDGAHGLGAFGLLSLTPFARARPNDLRPSDKALEAYKQDVNNNGLSPHGYNGYSLRSNSTEQDCSDMVDFKINLLKRSTDDKGSAGGSKAARVDSSGDHWASAASPGSGGVGEQAR